MIGGERTELMDALARPLKTAQSARVISRRFQRIVWAWIASAALMNLQAAADTNVQSASPGLTRSPAALSPLDRLAAAFSPRLRALATERDELVEQLAGIPTPNSAPTSEAFGLHSAVFRSAANTSWAQVDLGAERSMETIVLVPARVAVGEYPGQGYGFPKRFRVELANDAAFTLPRIVADFTREDFPNPGDQPVLIQVAGERARYVRVTATKLWQHGDEAVLALGELMVMSGDRNLAVGQPVRASYSMESLPQWSSSHLVDGQSVLGLPLEAAPSPSNGYHSLEHETRQDAVKWVQVDLGRSLPLDEVRLIPSRPRDWALVSGFGFPLRFRVEASDEPTFASPILLRAEDTNDFRNPGENPVTVPCEGVTARFIRVTATKLWLRTDYYAFALAELQVFAGGTNAALGARVEALDSVESGYWSKRALVDGFSSQKRLAPLGAWLRNVGRRGELETRLKQLDGEFARQTQDTLASLGRWSIVAMVVVITGIALLAYRYRLVRLLELERLRTSIATDLHDELGTRLTRIGLLSEMVERQTEEAHPAKSQVTQISAMTREMVRTMDEIVWAVNPRNDTLEDLANYIFHFTQEFFRHASVRCRLDIPADLPPLRLTTEIRHNLFLAVKEALNNVVKHAQAMNVRVTLKLDAAVLSIVVQDDGRGFAPDSQRPGGNGLRNMQQRLESIGGRAEVETEAGKGTTVRFQTKLHAGKRGR